MPSHVEDEQPMEEERINPMEAIPDEVIQLNCFSKKVMPITLRLVTHYAFLMILGFQGF